jgi:phospholipid-binding lipoprotein MlaA
MRLQFGNWGSGFGEPMRRVALRGCWLAMLVILQACATVTNPDRRDPMESFNRSMFSVNDAVDGAVLKPVATAYRAVTPDWFRTGVHNFFNNLEDVWSVANNLLQGRGSEALDNTKRVAINSTVGLLGTFDVASRIDIERHPSGFGLTLGRWGVGAGPYIVLPLLGPSTLREVAALPVDYRGNLANQIQDEATRNGVTVLNLVNLRSTYLDAGNVVDGAALDKYSFIREAYLQRLRNKVYDGDPPEEEAEPQQPEPAP